VIKCDRLSSAMYSISSGGLMLYEAPSGNLKRGLFCLCVCVCVCACASSLYIYKCLWHITLFTKLGIGTPKWLVLRLLSQSASLNTLLSTSESGCKDNGVVALPIWVKDCLFSVYKLVVFRNGSNWHDKYLNSFVISSGTSDCIRKYFLSSH